MTYGSSTESKIAEVVEACGLHGGNSIIALAGVPGTGKSYIASIAAQRFASDPLLVREVQFHQSFSYEEFIEGLRIDPSKGVSVQEGIFLEWNTKALQDPHHRYVLLIEELTRANLSAVLGELITFIEHRTRPFIGLYSRRPLKVAPNLTIVATFNPVDRSAIEIDAAIIRRLRIIAFPPSTGQLREMLSGSDLSEKAKGLLENIFTTCEKQFPADYKNLMPFGHGIFATAKKEIPDLNKLWVERIEHLLYRPLMGPHPFAEVISKNYPWQKPDFGAT